MSMIEKFLENKNTLTKGLTELKVNALKAVQSEADAMIDEFIEGVRAMVAEASDEEFVAFITSGKLDDEDIAAVIAFRGEATHKEENGEEPTTDEKRDGPKVMIINIG